MFITALREAGFASPQSATTLQRFVSDRASLEVLSRPSCLPFAYAEALSAGAAPRPGESRGVVTVPVARDTFLLVRNFPPSVYARLPLAPHLVQTPPLHFLEAVIAAFRFLEHYYAEGHEFVAQYLRLLVLVTIEPQPARDATLLTSCSLPALPFCSFVSEKALVHLPPRHIAAMPDTAVLAENIFHEALHNALTLDILARRVFKTGFRAASWPRVTIPWRADAREGRDRTWPVDRVLHALFVYVGLAGMRLHLLRTRGIDRARRDLLVEALPTAAKAMIHLAQALHDFDNCFTADGLDAVHSLRSTAIDTAGKIARSL